MKLYFVVERSESWMQFNLLNFDMLFEPHPHKATRRKKWTLEEVYWTHTEFVFLGWINSNIVTRLFSCFLLIWLSLMIFIIIIIIIEWGFHISQAIQEPPTLTVLRDLQPALLRGHSRLVTAQLLLAASPPCKGFAKASLGPPNHSAETIVYSMTFVQLLFFFFFFWP